MNPHPSTSTTTSNMMLVSQQFLHILVDSQIVTNTQIWNVQAEVVTLYGQIHPWVRTILKIVEDRFEYTRQAFLSKIQFDLHTCIDDFEGRVSSQFSRIEMPDLGDIMDVLRVEVFFLTESYMLSISLTIPLFIHLATPSRPR